MQLPTTNMCTDPRGRSAVDNIQQLCWQNGDQLLVRLFKFFDQIYKLSKSAVQALFC